MKLEKLEKFYKDAKEFHITSRLTLCNWELQKSIYVSHGIYKNISEPKSVSVGEKWGNIGETGVFGTSIKCGEAPENSRVFFRCITGGEAQLYINGKRFAGNDPNHFSIDITDVYKNNFTLDLKVESFVRVCQDAVGDAITDNGSSGIFSMAEIVITDIQTEELLKDIAFALDLGYCSDEYRFSMEKVLSKIFLAADISNPQLFRSNAENFRMLIDSAISALAPLSDCQKVYMIGQSHLDLAWFWTQFETYRKVGRTFSTVLQLQKKYPFYKFSMPQLKLFEMVKEYDPQLFSDLKASVLNGATEPSGMFYLEPDTNLVWGEALVRQLLRGKKILKENFGKLTCSESLIDAFGYSGNLPQILKQCGIENVFLTKMMWYNDTTEFPYSIFSWKGIDGTTVTAATMPWFNRQCTPRELKENVSKNKQKNLLKDTPVFFGWGDGGGSADDIHLSFLERLLKWQKPYKTDSGTIDDFFKKASYCKTELPEYFGEIYQEGHRGCYTSQCEIKRRNRELENSIRSLELISSYFVGYDAEKYQLNLNSPIDILLTNQFHDILPGSSVGKVYEIAHKDFDNAKRLLDAEWNKLKNVFGRNEHSATVFTPTSYNGYSRISVPIKEGNAYVLYENNLPLPYEYADDRLIFEVKASPYTFTPYFTKTISDFENSTFLTNESCLENNYVKLDFDSTGNISVLNKTNGLYTIKKGIILKLFNDNPMNCDAWDIDSDYTEGETVLTPVSVEGVFKSPVRSFIRLNYSFGKSRVKLTISLFNHAEYFDFDYEIQWNEKHKLLKHEFVTDFLSSYSVFDIPFGTIRRDTHHNNPYQQAKFEVPALTFADIGENNRGLCIISESKNGYKCEDNILSVSLLRSPAHPDPEADIGSHSFHISMYPHSGSYTAEKIYHTAMSVVHPCLLIENTELFGCMFSLSKNSSANIETVKLSDDNSAFILRISEAEGSTCRQTLTFGITVKSVTECLLNEEPVADVPLQNNSFEFILHPNEIKSFIIKVR